MPPCTSAVLAALATSATPGLRVCIRIESTEPDAVGFISEFRLAAAGLSTLHVTAQRDRTLRTANLFVLREMSAVVACRLGPSSRHLCKPLGTFCFATSTLVVEAPRCGLRAVSVLSGRLLSWNLVTNGSFSGFLGPFRPERAQEPVERPVGNQISAQKLTKKPRDGSSTTSVSLCSAFTKVFLPLPVPQ